MFVPLYDDNPLRSIKLPFVTWTLIAINVVVFLSTISSFTGDEHVASIVDFALVPAVFTNVVQPSYVAYPVPTPLTFVTYMFLHGGWMHLIGNMLFLWVFGDNVEDDMGHLRYLVFYLLCGILAGAAHTIAAPGSLNPLVGASGAIAGVIAAYLMLHPRVKVWVLVLMRIPIKIPAIWALGAWIVWQFISVAMSGNDNTAWWAHIGGLAAGAALVTVFRRPDVRLFDRGIDVERLPPR